MSIVTEFCPRLEGEHRDRPLPSLVAVQRRLLDASRARVDNARMERLDLWLPEEAVSEILKEAAGSGARSAAAEWGVNQ